jgi:estrone sulfotransferase
MQRCAQALKIEVTDESNVFIRKGKTGTWREHFSPEVMKQFEEWERKHLQGSDLKFVYQL